MLLDLWQNFQHNLFKPLLMFFYMGFSVPIIGITFDYPHVLYQSITIYLLIAIGWHGGEELASLSAGELGVAVGFMGIGFLTNLVLGFLAYFILRKTNRRLRKVDAATVAGFYGSDSAGTFVTCLGVLIAAKIPYAGFMSVLLATMEVPGCLVALFLVARLRSAGMDSKGYMPDEPGHNPHSSRGERQLTAAAVAPESSPDGISPQHPRKRDSADKTGIASILAPELLKEVFLNQGIFLLFGGIIIGFVGRLQGVAVVAPEDPLFVTMFQGMLCLFLLEMGMTASKRLRDLKTAGWRFILFGLLAPNLFALIGICVAHLYSMALGRPFLLGTYALFAVLCAAASYIAVPAIQRLAIPESSPTLPLASSLGLTFSYNVTVGIPVYIMISQAVINTFPVGA